MKEQRRDVENQQKLTDLVRSRNAAVASYCYPETELGEIMTLEHVLLDKTGELLAAAYEAEAVRFVQKLPDEPRGPRARIYWEVPHKPGRRRNYEVGGTMKVHDGFLAWDSRLDASVDGTWSRLGNHGFN